MKKFYPGPWLHFTCMAIFMLVIGILPSPAQQKDVEAGLVHIKVTESLASQLERSAQSRTAGGIAITGIGPLDAYSRRYNVKRFKRVFRHAGKFEARHRRHNLHRWYEISLDTSISVDAAVRAYRSLSGVEQASAVYKKARVGSTRGNFTPVITSKENNAMAATLPGAANDPVLPTQWHYNNTGQNEGTPGADIRLFDAWKKETGKPEVIVAVTDGGIDYTHRDLAANVWRNTGETADNGIDDDNNGYVDDVYGYNFSEGSSSVYPDYHGTHVAGTIAATTNNGIGVAGVAGGSGNGDGVRVMSCAVFSEGWGDGFAEAYVYAADNGAVISQNSWGYLSAGNYEQAVLDGIDYFIEEAGKDINGNQAGPMNGGIVIFSSGNDDDQSNYYPGYYAPVLSVAATTNTDKKAWYSNFGTWVDIAAPGGETDFSDALGVISTLPGNSYGSLMGTSMACPHVSGVAALVLSKFGKAGFTPAMLRQRLIQTTANIDALNPGYTGKLGSGRLDAAAALQDNDNTAPNAIANLAVTGFKITTVTLSWTVPTDAGGFVTTYDIRYSTTPITAANFNAATRVSNPPAPLPAGSTQTFTVTGLQGGTQYYFAARALDFQENTSALSNIVSATTEWPPVISADPASITESLQTAQTSTRTFTLHNTGQGPLEFTLLNATTGNDFAACSPASGNVSPGSEAVITVDFDANGLTGGTYSKDLAIYSNDPERDTLTVALSLQVASNNAPIARGIPASLHFKSVQTGTSSNRYIIIENAGSEPLVVDQATTDNNSFTTSFEQAITIAPFKTSTLTVIYSPATTGLATATLTLHTNDPATPSLQVNLAGEGLNQPPVQAIPATVTAEVAKGASTPATLTLKNNGSFDRAYRIAVTSNGLITPTSQSSQQRPGVAARSATAGDTARDTFRTQLKAKLNDIDPLLKALPASKRAARNAGNNTQARMQAATADQQLYYDFEDMQPGRIDGQEGWWTYDENEWTVATANPAGGAKHLRGASRSDGEETYCISPMVWDDWLEYSVVTFATMRINVSSSAGSTWQVIPEDPFSYVATRIRFNPDGTADALVVDENYNSHWERIEVEVPSGYFDLAIENDGRGDEESGLTIFSIYFNNVKVFRGRGIGPVIGEVAFVNYTSADNSTLDVDNLRYGLGEFAPVHIHPSPATGIIPAGGTAQVSLGVDTKELRYGTYSSDIITHLDEADQLIVPATVTVNGPADISFSPHIIQDYIYPDNHFEDYRPLVNTGGQPLTFAFEHNIPGLTIEPASGTVSVRGSTNIYIHYDATGAQPGFLEGTVKFTSSTERMPQADMPFRMIIIQEGAIFSLSGAITKTVRRGEIAAETFYIENTGTNEMSWEIPSAQYPSWISMEPRSGKVGNIPQPVTITFDARNAGEGEYATTIGVYSNATNRIYLPLFTTMVVQANPDTGTGNIIREEWTGITGKSIASIPLDTPPASTTGLTLFEAPANNGDNYGSRVRGYVWVPTSGEYTFWIASDDNSELWLSTDENPANKVKIATVSGYTKVREWEKYITQRSDRIFLASGKKYYIEALHKESTGSDHLAVGWQLPDGTMERPIPGARLIPDNYSAPVNASPAVAITSPTDGADLTSPAAISIVADATDSDGTVVKVDFYNGSTRLGSDASAPYSFTWRNVVAGSYNLMAKAFDNRGATDSVSVSITVSEPACAGAGTINREVWTNVPGTSVSAIPLSTLPSSVTALTLFETPYNYGNNYGSRVRGYLCIPATGAYTFWIASDDQSELWLSTDENPANKVKIASITGHTSRRQWDKYASQQSAPITLQAGRKYYIEALHKEGTGTDHLAVGWQRPDGTPERPMQAGNLIPFAPVTTNPPIVRITRPVEAQYFLAPASVSIGADAADNGTILKVEFFEGYNKLGEDNIAPYTFAWNNVSAGDYNIRAIATDNDGNMSTDSLQVVITQPCTASGLIRREVWFNVPGTSVSAIPVDTPPSQVTLIPSFETTSSDGDNYGNRVSGYLCVPTTGNYRFWISSDDQSELWLSTNNDPAHKVKIADVPSHTSKRQWDKYASQKSALIYLVTGQQYYIEALHKEGTNADHLAVGWQLPNSVMERPIPGNRLSADAASTATGYAAQPIADSDAGDAISLYPNPARQGQVTLLVTNDIIAGSDASIEILAVTGKVVLSKQVSCGDNCSTVTIDIDNNVVAGIYTVNAVIGGRRYTKRLVVY